MHIRVVLPLLHSDVLVEKAREEYRKAASKNTQLSFVTLPNGTQTIESEYDKALVQPETIKAIIEAEREGIDACIIGCIRDPGAEGAKEMVSIPVVGEGEAAFHFAHLLGYRYSIITIREETIPSRWPLVQRVGLSERMASVRAVPYGVMDLSLSAVDDVVTASLAAVKQDGADVIVMSCTGTGVDLAAVVEERIREAAGVYIPVIDPVKAAIILAQGLVATGMSHSKKAYPIPPNPRAEYRFHTE
jgi:allantoin racemase